MQKAIAISTIGLLLMAFAPAASAITITNDGEETVHVWIENWMHRLREGKTATFNPTEVPTTILFETRHQRITCVAEADSEVRVTHDKCFVDGAESGETRMHL